MKATGVRSGTQCLLNSDTPRAWATVAPGSDNFRGHT